MIKKRDISLEEFRKVFETSLCSDIPKDAIVQFHTNQHTRGSIPGDVVLRFSWNEPDPEPEPPVEGQYYRHYTGHVYRVVRLARHHQTGQQLVVYTNRDILGYTYVRPLYGSEDDHDG